MAGSDGDATLTTSNDFDRSAPCWWHSTGCAESMPSHGAPEAIICAIAAPLFIAGQA